MRLFETIFFVYDKKLEDLTGKSEDKELQTVIDLDHVCRVGQWNDNEDFEIMPDCCMVYMRGGESLLVKTPYFELIAAWKGEEDAS